MGSRSLILSLKKIMRKKKNLIPFLLFVVPVCHNDRGVSKLSTTAKKKKKKNQHTTKQEQKS